MWPFIINPGPQVVSTTKYYDVHPIIGGPSMTIISERVYGLILTYRTNSHVPTTKGFQTLKVIIIYYKHIYSTLYSTCLVKVIFLQ